MTSWKHGGHRYLSQRRGVCAQEFAYSKGIVWECFVHHWRAWVEMLRKPSDYKGIVREALILQGKCMEIPPECRGSVREEAPRVEKSCKGSPQSPHFLK